MAYMSQENKASKMPAIKAVLKKYGMKGSVAVRHYSTLIVNVREGKIDFAANEKEVPANTGGWRGYSQINPYWIETHWSGRAAAFLTELKAAMSVDNYDNSDIMTDYHDCGWYVEINIGRYDKHYVSV